MSEPVRIQQADFSQDEEIKALKASSKRMGGIATFLGCARDFSEGREVSEISFDAYGSMALSEMNKLRSEAIAEIWLAGCAHRASHRYGEGRRQHRVHRGGCRTPCRRAGSLPLDD